MNLALLGLWIVSGALIATLWLVRLRYLRVSFEQRQLLTPTSYAGVPDGAPRLSVLVAAKDEEQNIERCLQSLLDQDYPNYEVIAIDDRSTDRTPELLRALQAQHPDTLRVLTITELRDGWFGKNNAMREGAKSATGDYLLFMDADCCLRSRRTLTIGMHDMLAHGVGMMSMQPMLDTPTWWEKLLQPVCSLVLMLWFVPQKVNDPSRKAAYATGMFMLFSRRCYDAIGGHECVRTYVNEDIHLARHVKRGGHGLRLTDNDGLYQVRMYTTPRQACRGWARIFYGSLMTVRRLVNSGSALFWYTIFPWVSFIVALVVVAQGSGETLIFWQVACAVWAVAVVCMQVMLWRFYAMVYTPPIWSLGFVLGAVVASGILISSLLQSMGLKGTTWRGTTYVGDKVTSTESSEVANSIVDVVGGTPATTSETTRPGAEVTSP